MTKEEHNRLPRRIRKFVRDATDLSVAEIEKAVSEHALELYVEGKESARVTEETLVFERDVVTLRGKELSDNKVRRTYVMNKPGSVTTTTADPRGKQDLSRWLSTLPPGLFPIGRLDRATTGALLLSSDGELASAVLLPEHHVSKLYWLWLGDSVSPHDPRLNDWLTGMTVCGQIGKAAKVEVLSHSEHMSELLVTLRQGLNRQIRRMCRLSNFRLLHLHRKMVGSVSVDGLELGGVRELSREEVDRLWD